MDANCYPVPDSRFRRAGLGFLDVFEHLLLCLQKLDKHSELVLVQHAVANKELKTFGVRDDCRCCNLCGAKGGRLVDVHFAFLFSTGPRVPGVIMKLEGNICRSPMAEGVFRTLAARAGLIGRVRIDSAATHDYYTGGPPDWRATQAALRRGYDLPPLRARQVEVADFARFDRIYAMDRMNLDLIEDASAALVQRLASERQ